jgi:hypothetical protein
MTLKACGSGFDFLSSYLLQKHNEGVFGIILAPTDIDLSPVADDCVNLAVRNFMDDPGCNGDTAPEIDERRAAVIPGSIQFSNDEPVG